MLITITRLQGSGHTEVAERVAEALRWEVAGDRAFILQVAERAGLPPEEVARRQERIPSFIERLARVTATSFPEMFGGASDSIDEFEEEKLVKITRNLVTELAAEGRMVLVGYGAAAVLAHERDVVHVRLVAPREFRVQRVAEELSLGSAEAGRTVEEWDKRLVQYHQTYYGRDPDDPTHYHMVLNTALLGLEGAADLIVAHARSRGW